MLRPLSSAFSLTIQQQCLLSDFDCPLQQINFITHSSKYLIALFSHLVTYLAPVTRIGYLSV